ncbi:hypothetical protein Tco_0862546 [Tanacetum coccineum]
MQNCLEQLQRCLRRRFHMTYHFTCGSTSVVFLEEEHGVHLKLESGITEEGEVVWLRGNQKDGVDAIEKKMESETKTKYEQCHGLICSQVLRKDYWLLQVRRSNVEEKSARRNTA